jgi:hypothetical protein
VTIAVRTYSTVASLPSGFRKVASLVRAVATRSSGSSEANDRVWKRSPTARRRSHPKSLTAASLTNVTRRSRSSPMIASPAEVKSRRAKAWLISFTRQVIRLTTLIAVMKRAWISAHRHGCSIAAAWL